MSYWDIAQPFVDAGLKFLGGIGAALGVYFGWRRLKSNEDKQKPIFEVEVKKTTAAEYILEVNVRNQTGAAMSVRKVELLKPKNIDIAVFHIWGGRMPPELTASGLPIDVQIPIEPAKEAGVSFLVITKAEESIRLKITWLSHKEKPKMYEKVVEFPLSLFRLIDGELGDYRRTGQSA